MKAFSVIFAACLLSLVQCTPLDDYVNAFDPTYTYSLVSNFRGDFYTVYVVSMTSQSWLTPQDTTIPVWKHWLTICVPDRLDKTKDYAFMYIEGGDVTDPVPTSLDDFQALICSLSTTVVAQLNQIPNEPMQFIAEGKRRTEDAIIAYTWRHFLNDTSKPDWLLRLPMTKAAVRGLDTIQAVVPNIVPGLNINQFVVGGASKRGWTTWTTGIVDPRVKAIVPIVIPILNIQKNLDHHFRAYNGWSFALDDYVDQGITHLLHTPEFSDMAAIIDPYAYLDRLQKPKYMICSTGDEFFLPDSPEFFYDDLQGDKYLRMVPNAEHTLIGHQYDVVVTLTSWYQAFVEGVSIPQYSWKTVKSNTTNATITAYAVGQKPTVAKMWSAHTLSTEFRDFRLVKCFDPEHCLEPIFWWDVDLEPEHQVINGQDTWIYTASQPQPPYGWVGFFIELDYVYSDTETPIQEMKFTTSVNVVPDIMPFPPCTTNC